MSYTGQCHCGNVKFETDLKPMLVFQCNCNSCRRLTGSVGVRALYSSDEVTWTGAISEYVYQGGSGGNLYTQHCPNCHTNAYTTFDFMEGMTSIPIGMFEEPQDIKPWLEIWTDAKLNWVKDDGCITNSVPDSGVQERLVEVLESLENR
ncbi:GFA family protein [Gammaproteobacteria bacterium]|nr:GFA family protein [Gammaproteobacteria bacterium]